MEFRSLESEQYREYLWPDGSCVRIDAPVSLSISGSGGHRVLSGDGISHYIPEGWNHLRWASKDGQQPFDF